MALFSLVGGLIGASKAKKASKKAEKAQSKGIRQAMDEERLRFGQTEAQYQPYVDAGTQALGGYGNLVGLGGAEQQQAAIDQLRNSPFYQSLYRRGEEALLQNASATGGLRGGDTERGLADFGADTLATTIDRQLGNLGNLTTLGSGMTGQLGQFRQALADNIANLQVGQGQAKAQDYLTRGAISARNWQNIGSFGDQAAAAIAGGIGAGGGFGAMGAGGAPFDMTAMMNSIFGAAPAAQSGGMGGFGGFGSMGGGGGWTPPYAGIPGPMSYNPQGSFLSNSTRGGY